MSVLEPGRKLDWAVFEAIRGLTDADTAILDCEHCVHVSGDTEITCCADCVEIPNYSTDHDAAWQVVRAMWEKGYGVEIKRAADGKVDVDFRNKARWEWACWETMPTAVCIAALGAWGVEVDE